MHLGSLLWQTAASMGQECCAPALLHTHTYAHQVLSVLLPWARLTGLPWPVLQWVRGAFLPMCCVWHPTFPVFLQHRDVRCFSLTSANLISFSAFPLPRGRSGGMIVDPLRSGCPQPGIDPSSGIPGRLPPGAVPPGARFDPFGPLGAGRSG